MQRYILTLRCPDQPGIVHALAAGVAEAKGNILESAQFSDPGTGIFTIRVSLETPDADTESLRDELTLRLARFDPVLTVRPEEQRRRVLLMVSKFDHCLVDLLYRWGSGELPVDIPLIVSNHHDLAPVAKCYGIPFVHIPVTRDTKPEAEAELLRLVDEHRTSTSWCSPATCRSSPTTCARKLVRPDHQHPPLVPAGLQGRQALPPGPRAGRQAHRRHRPLRHRRPRRGPDHRAGRRPRRPRHTAPELVAIGRDVERIVLARAVRLPRGGTASSSPAPAPSSSPDSRTERLV